MTERTPPPSESFLARRARLKARNQRAARDGRREPATDAATAGAPPPATGDDRPAQADPAESAERVLTDADKPPTESLGAESDFSQFLSSGVSDALRRRALRKLFALPQFGVLDGLNDYDEDYTKFEPLGEMLTYHKRRLLEQEREARGDAGDRPPGEAGPVARAESDAPAAAAGGSGAPAEADGEPAEAGDGGADADEAAEAAEAFDDDGDLQA